jgi:hypothetical protein
MLDGNVGNKANLPSSFTLHSTNSYQHALYLCIKLYWRILVTRGRSQMCMTHINYTFAQFLIHALRVCTHSDVSRHHINSKFTELGKQCDSLLVRLLYTCAMAYIMSLLYHVHRDFTIRWVLLPCHI